MLHEIVNFADDLLIATALIVTTCVIHGFGMDRMMSGVLFHYHPTRTKRPRPLTKMLMGVFIRGYERPVSPPN